MTAARSIPGVEEILVQASPRGRAMYRMVRELIDELEEAAPWALLYAPPADGGELARRLGELLERIAAVPRRVDSELERLAGLVEDDDAREALDEAGFYFSTLHQMTAVDQQRLRGALARLADSDPPSRAEADHLCELAADLKGKYTSATMSAAASLVGEGRGLGVGFEARLFPEKAEEAERNRRLLDGLTRAVRAHRAVVAGFAWRGVLASWREGRPVDRYALGDLVSLRAHLLYLLGVANRRALYSGDYQFLRGRETHLGERLRELESLHIHSLELVPESAEAAGVFTRLEELLLEIAALLDVEVVRQELGAPAIEALRAGRAPQSEAAGEARLDGLVELLADEDLRTFLELLIGNVRKRASLGQRAVEPEALRAAVERPGRAAAPVRLDPSAGRAYAERLVAALTRLTAADNPRWKAFQMVQKLQARLGALPPALLHELAPFLGELDGDLLPILAEAAVAGAVPPAAVDALRTSSARLADHDLSRPDAAREIAGDLGRVARLLDSLRAAAEALRLTK